MIRVVIAEDQKLLREALVSLISLEDDIEIAAEAADGESAWEAVLQHQPDVCLLDIEIPSPSGLEIAERLRQCGSSCRIIIVTTYARPGFLQKAMELKVEGYLLKDEPIDFLINAIRKVIQGETVISLDLAAALFLKEENPLTEREMEVLRMSRDGMSTKAIAKSLFLTEGTVRNYLSLAIQKLGVDTRQQATEKASEQGWL